MEIHKGKYRINDRNLNFDMVDGLNFNNRGGCFYFRGGNGFGKTSFLEKIIIPALKADNLPYLYIGQDIRTQLYTLRALLSIQGFKVSDTDEVELLRLWINQGQAYLYWMSLINISQIMVSFLTGVRHLSGTISS